MAVALPEYLWIVIVGFIFGFGYAFGIGANDVANAFGSTVASKSLTLKQAVIVASIFEFLGSLLLGATVTNTIRSKIFDVDLYEGEEDIVLLGMFTSLLTGTFMLNGATYFALPVSTTHTIVGAIMGFSIVAKGFSSINWETATQIFISWGLSPLVSGIVAFCFFFCIRYFVMHTENPFQRAYYTFPIVLTIFIGIDLFYVLYKGMNNTAAGDLPLQVTLPVSFAVGFVVGLIWIFWWGPWAMRRVETRAANMQAAKDKTEKWEEIDVDGDGVVEKVEAPQDLGDSSDADGVEAADKTDEDGETPEEEEAPEEEAPGGRGFKGYLKKSLHQLGENTYNQDLHSQSMHESKRAAEIWDDAEAYDPNAEQLFTYVQVFTACLNSFAHGANDVANAIAPLSAILLIYQTGELSSKAPVEKWILAYGGVGIVVGLLIFGYRVMKSIGYKLTGLSPSRGASAELGASLFVVTASFLGIPVSSTQSIIGAVTGVGLVGGWKNVQWLFLLRICLGWAAVFFSAVLINAGVFAMFAFSPSLTE